MVAFMKNVYSWNFFKDLLTRFQSKLTVLELKGEA